MRGTAKTDTYDRFGEIADARATVIKQYFDNYTDFFAAFAAQDYVRDALKNPTDSNIAYLEQQLKAYKADRDCMEGMFGTTLETLC